MSDFVTSLIRTWVPAGVAAGVTYVVTLGVEFDPAAETQIAAAAVLVVTAVYYGVVRALENRWPAFGYLLGVAKAPTYNNPGE